MLGGLASTAASAAAPAAASNGTATGALAGGEVIRIPTPSIPEPEELRDDDDASSSTQPSPQKFFLAERKQQLLARRKQPPPPRALFGSAAATPTGQEAQQAPAAADSPPSLTFLAYQQNFSGPIAYSPAGAAEPTASSPSAAPGAAGSGGAGPGAATPAALDEEEARERTLVARVHWAQAVISNVMRKQHARESFASIVQQAKEMFMTEAAVEAGAENGRYYSNAALMVRAGLRHEPEVAEALAYAWEKLTLAESNISRDFRAAPAPVAVAGLMSLEGNAQAPVQSLSREAYGTMIRKLYLLLHQQEADPKIDAVECLMTVKVPCCYCAAEMASTAASAASGTAASTSSAAAAAAALLCPLSRLHFLTPRLFSVCSRHRTTGPRIRWALTTSRRPPSTAAGLNSPTCGSTPCEPTTTRGGCDGAPTASQAGAAWAAATSYRGLVGLPTSPCSTGWYST